MKGIKVRDMQTGEEKVGLEIPKLLQGNEKCGQVVLRGLRGEGSEGMSNRICFVLSSVIRASNSHYTVPGPPWLPPPTANSLSYKKWSRGFNKVFFFLFSANLLQNILFYSSQANSRTFAYAPCNFVFDAMLKKMSRSQLGLCLLLGIIFVRTLIT